ncbi:cytochrome P450 pisatin demethylase [Lecanosticta acicola]|uniref:Cytochrome P450 pisatin demethylase n=1 Tax=Lecanosticta acicola TaxID=111012 RepID=A0AAI8YSA3_9PEZI|nr:cytochrome P450 pisatin demethylase [Lecanosticta acicola]
MLTYYIVSAALVLWVIVGVVRYVVRCLSFPSAPGSPWARWTKIWYIQKVWQGHFEEWDIKTHDSGARKVVRLAPNMYSIDDPESAMAIYGVASTMPKSKWYDAWGDPSVPNHNLFSTTDRTVHAAMRRRVANMYSLSTIKSYEPGVDNCIRILIKCFDEFAETGKVFDPQHWMQCYAFDVIGEITFGHRVGFLESGGEDIDDIMKGVDALLYFSTLSGLSVALLPILFILYGNPNRAIAAFTRRLHEKAGKEGPQNEGEKDTDGTFAAKLAKLRGKDLPEVEAARLENATLLTNVAAGSDTTSISLTGTLYYLFKTDGVQERMLSEIHSKQTSSDEVIGFEQTQQMPYLQMVMKEALRLHSAVGLPMWRDVVDNGITLAGTFFPPGCTVGINPWVAHQNKTVFGPEADKFIPERWDPQNTAPEQLTRMENYYLPFGAGSRTCIGKHISHLEMAKVIPELVKRYEFEFLKEGYECANTWFVKQKEIMVKVKRRQ